MFDTLVVFLKESFENIFFFKNQSYILLYFTNTNEPRRHKTCSRGFRPSETETSLLGGGVMLHIKLKGMQRTTMYMQIFALIHTPLTPTMRSKDQNSFLSESGYVAYQI